MFQRNGIYYITILVIKSSKLQHNYFLRESYDYNLKEL